MWLQQLPVALDNFFCLIQALRDWKKRRCFNTEKVARWKCVYRSGVCNFSGRKSAPKPNHNSTIKAGKHKKSLRVTPHPFRDNKTLDAQLERNKIQIISLYLGASLCVPHYNAAS